jgi:hypothetical protein
MINLPSIVDKLYKKWLEKPFYNSLNIEARPINKDQYGVFTTKDIRQFDCLEYVRGLQLGHKSKYHNDPIILERAKPYACYCKDCQMHGNSLFLPTGHMTNYRFTMNQNDANADSFFIYDRNLFIVYAIKPIIKNEEVILFYKNEKIQAEINKFPTPTLTE